MLTADSITDAQVMSAPVEALIRKVALHRSGSPWLQASRSQARQKCADAINARTPA